MAIPQLFAGRFLREADLLQRKTGALYRGRDEPSGQAVTLHVFPVNQTSRKKHVALALSQIGRVRELRHPGLVPIIGCGFESDCFYLVTLPLTACSLRSMITERRGPLPLELLLDTFFQIAGAVSALHNEEVVHSRISSESVLVNEEGAYLGGYYPTALDHLDPGQCLLERAALLPSYLAPEFTALNEPGPLVDVYALGALLYEGAVGQPPPPAHASACAGSPSAALVFPAKLNPQIPPLLDAVIVKALNREPSGRLSSVAELINAVAVAVERQTHLVAVQGSPAQYTALRSGDEVDPVQAFVSAQMMHPKTERINIHNLDAELEQRLAAEAAAAGAASGASFIMLNGPLRGERYWIDSDLVMIGSDLQCGIHVKGKEVALHHAVISQKQDGYSISSLTPNGLVVNGQHIPGRGDIPLSQGDIVLIGKSKLRFIPPQRYGELVEEPSQPLVEDGAAATSQQRERVATRTAVPNPPDEPASANAPGRGAATWQFGGPLADDEYEEGRGFEFSPPLLGAATAAILIAMGALIYALQGGSASRVQTSTQAAASQTIGANVTEAASVVSLPEPASDESQPINAVSEEENPDLVASSAQNPGGDLLGGEPSPTKGEETNILEERQAQEVAQRMLAKVQEYRLLGQITAPPGENARDVLLELREQDPKNTDARKLYTEIAADAVIAADLARASGRSERMKRSYAVALDLGLNPMYLQGRESDLRQGAPKAGLKSAIDSKRVLDAAGWGITKEELDASIRSQKGSHHGS